MAIKVNTSKEKPDREKAHQTLPHFLLREIDALRELDQHPNIVQMFDLFRDKRDGSRLYMIFEFLEGGDLRSFTRARYNRGMPIDMVLSFTEQLLKATEYLHAKGFVHRDIKSANIVLGGQGSLTKADGTQS